MQAKKDYTDITLTRSPEPEMRYTSGLTVYDEQFIEGRLIGCYWSATGRIKPATDIVEFKKPPAFNVPVQAFDLNIDGQDCRHGWTFVTAEEKKEQGSHHGVVELTHNLKPIQLKIHTHLDGTPFIRRYLEITNKGARPMALISVAPWCGVLARWGSFPNPDFQKTPFSLGRYTGNNWAQEGRFVWEPLTNGVTTHLQASGPLGTCGYQCPYFLLRNEGTSEYFTLYLGWSGTWSADILCDTTLYQILHVSLGPTAPAPIRMLEPGETIQTPAVHIGYVQGDFDACVQSAHDHIRTSVVPQNPRLPQPAVGYNHYFGYMQHKLDEAGLLEDVDIAAEIGCDIFVVDSGWYGKGSTALRDAGPYSRFLGDWVAGEWLPNDLDPIIRKAHEKKMLFGLWIEPEGIAEMSEIYKQHPDWTVKVRGKLVPAVAERLTLDYTNPEVRAWVESELTRIIKRYKLDILRIDAGPMHIQVGERMIHGFAESTSWRHHEILYAILDKLREKFPKLIIENCCGGGARLDLGILERTHWTEITDEDRVPRLIQILNGMTIMLPPEIQKYFFGFLQISERGSLDTMIRVIIFSGMPVFAGISPKLKDANPLVIGRIKHYIVLFKTFIAPMLKTCKVYHHTPVVDIEHQPLTDYCVLEYVAEDRNRGFTGVFKLTNAGEPYIFYPRGLNPGKQYRITFDNSGFSSQKDGLELMQTGIRLEISRALSSELILFEAE